MKRLFLIATLVGAAPALADEGMWTYNNFPSAKVKEKYGFEPSQEWLDKARLSSARLAGGCSASFVSPNGLVMTNHHCARGCIEQLSGAKKDYIANGFYAKTEAEETQCPAMEINQLEQITDVTETLNKATAGLSGKPYSDTLKAKMSELEQACSAGEAKVRCDVVTLYQGGKYNLYKYRRFQDVRLVMAPEHAIAFFGGDPDNFEFPRWDLDVTFLRVYQDGKPAKTENFFKWSEKSAKEGDLTFVSGHPGRTSRGLTIAELEYQRDVAMPKMLFTMSELRGMVTEFQKRGPEQKRISNNLLFGVENGLKATKGRLEALQDKKFFAQKVAAEQELRKKVDANPEMKKKYGAAWDEIAKAQGQLVNIRKDLAFVEQGNGLSSSLYGIAKMLVRASEELPKENGQRLREFNQANLPALQAQLLSPAPIYADLEILRLTFGLTKMREELGSNHPFVKKVLGKESPEKMAARLVKGSKLCVLKDMKGSKVCDVSVRKGLWDGGKAAIAASKDPMIQLALALDADGRAVRKNYEENIDAVIKKNAELVAKAKFEAYGTNQYPDATFSLRLSYGSVKGYMEDGKKVDPVTQMAGTFEHATGEEPFALPPSWLKSEKLLDGATAMNLVTTNDIIGGNSGSPMINKDAEIVGLVFDGNIQSLGGEYGFDESVNRTVAVHSDAIIESLKKIYGANRVLEELRPGSTKIPSVPTKPAG
ncbi:S46 family peptidase [Myxococcus qinghaiensis]|uniref:S46 family peptidase n=1 Tax=Myxococcus qinghaiensis TaxID=2906758 RepID=UPI0020A7B4A1|nr:S46 family peptidase [Myxococcus qinghaiensis]MCP3161978.1 S46 family peptidase [Myxococcus qinghaiensis]